MTTTGMTTTNTHPYQRGMFYESMPIPLVRERCVEVAAGPITFLVESRQLTNDILNAHLSEAPVDLSHVEFDDYGGTVHVCGRSDDVEYLRFDCFENEPHYHYIMHAAGGNLICRIDEVAEGSPLEWTLGRLRCRLAAMLDLAGAHQLAQAVEADLDQVASAVDRVAELLQRAQDQAVKRREATLPATA